jgi:hypothetical protein
MRARQDIRGLDAAGANARPANASGRGERAVVDPVRLRLAEGGPLRGEAGPDNYASASVTVPSLYSLYAWTDARPTNWAPNAGVPSGQCEIKRFAERAECTQV